MKISELINEGREELLQRMAMRRGMDGMEPEMDMDDEPEMELSSNADRKIVNAILHVCDKLKGEGNSRVDLLPFITQVSEKAGKMVRLADLIAVNKRSPEIQRIVDSIDEKSVKFKNTSVKNEDPAKAVANRENQNEATVKAMAGRAASRR